MHPIIQCQHCHYLFSEAHPQCTRCGQGQQEILVEIVAQEEPLASELLASSTPPTKTKLTEQLVIFIGIMGSIVLLSTSVNFTWQSDLTLSLFIAVITLIYYLGYTESRVRLLVPRKVELRPLAIVLAACTTTGLIIPPIMDTISRSMGEPIILVTEFFADAPSGKLMAYVLIAVMPAIFEELAYRGYLFQKVSQAYGTTSALWWSSIIWACMHFSIISLFWLVPFGLLLGWLRLRYRTLAYGILGHFIHNALVVWGDYEGGFF